MNTIPLVIVPGVGGSDEHHWQTWLQNYCQQTSRIEQQDWDLPVLDQWVDAFYRHIIQLKQPVQIVAHSFGCLTTIAALNQYPVLRRYIHSILLVAPANPERFSLHGFATAEANLSALFKQFRVDVPALAIISENDPWLSFSKAVEYATIWGIPFINHGFAGHINVASGYGKWPEVLSYLDNISVFSHEAKSEFFGKHYHFNFAI